VSEPVDYELMKFLHNGVFGIGFVVELILIPDALVFIGSFCGYFAVIELRGSVIETEDFVVVKNDHQEIIEQRINSALISAYVTDTVENNFFTVISILALFFSDCGKSKAVVAALSYIMLNAVTLSVHGDASSVCKAVRSVNNSREIKFTVCYDVIFLVVYGNISIFVRSDHKCLQSTILDRR